MKVGRQSQGLELVSIIGSENDVWHFGPGPSFTAIVFWLCEGVVGREL